MLKCAKFPAFISRLISLENHLPVDNQIFGGSNLGTVVVIPVSSNVPVANFTFELSLALNAIGKSYKRRAFASSINVFFFVINHCTFFICLFEEYYSSILF